MKIGQEFDHWDKNSHHCNSLSRKHIIPLITEEIKILKFVCKKPLGLVAFIEEFYSIHEEKYINGIFLQKTEQFLVHFMHRLSCKQVSYKMEGKKKMSNNKSLSSKLDTQILNKSLGNKIHIYVEVTCHNHVGLFLRHKVHSNIWKPISIICHISKLLPHII